MEDREDCDRRPIERECLWHAKVEPKQVFPLATLFKNQNEMVECIVESQIPRLRISWSGYVRYIANPAGAAVVNILESASKRASNNWTGFVAEMECRPKFMEEGRVKLPKMDYCY